jgi:protease YdgD
MKLAHLLLGMTIALIITITPALAKPTLTIATDRPIADLPRSGQSFLPPNRLKDNASSRTRGVICKPNQAATDCDDRVPVQSRDYPWSAIGRLQIGPDGHCTATLIADEWLLTNAHCVLNLTTHELVTDEITFSPNLIDGELQSADDRAKIIDIIIGTDFRDTDSVVQPNDWAILKIDRPLGKTHGTIGWKAIPTNLLVKNTKKFTLAGYSGDFPNPDKYPEFTAGKSFTAGLHKDCSFTGETNNKVLKHNCDMRAGSSGSAIIAWIDDLPYIVGINSAEYTNRFTGEDYENYAVNVNQLDTWMIQQNRTYHPTKSTDK